MQIADTNFCKVLLMPKCNCSAGLRACRAEGDSEWIFARNCEGTEPLRQNYLQETKEFVSHYADCQTLSLPL